MASAHEFRLQLRAFGQRQHAVISMIMRKAAFDIMGDLVKRSPVDTGHFQNSWMVGVGSPDRGAPEPGEYAGNAGALSLSRLRELTPATVDGAKPIYLSNNLPYGIELANGSSRQAGSGWIEEAVNRTRVEMSNQGLI